MTATIEAIYESGMLKLAQALPLADKARVLVTIHTDEPSQNSERAAWLKLSEETLTKTWDNPDDEVFNELLQK